MKKIDSNEEEGNRWVYRLKRETRMKKGKRVGPLAEDGERVLKGV